MFGTRITLAKNAKDEAEKPFWISYADLMTALMVLFLVAMSVALLAVTKKVDESEQLEKERKANIEACLDQVAQAAQEIGDIQIDRQRYAIDFGPRAHFERNQFAVKKETAARLRGFSRRVLEIARMECGKNWLRRVYIEGYASPEGTYLHNLNLSLNRSHNVLCVLLAPQAGYENSLTREEQEEARKLFLVGGDSFNSPQKNDEDSRRIELRLDFFEKKKTEKQEVGPNVDLGKCEVGNSARTD